MSKATVTVTINGYTAVVDADETFILEDGTLTTAGKLLVGDSVQITQNDVMHIGEVQAVELDIPTRDMTAEEQVIASLEARVAGLEEHLMITNQIIQGLQRSIVELTAQHIETLFKDDVMIDSIAQRIYIAGANAIAHKAKSSRNRAPKLVVVDTMIPGCVIRAHLTEEGYAVIEMLDKEGTWATGDDLPEQMRSEQIKTTFGNLLLSYGAELGRSYFITEDVALEDYREAVAAEARAVVQSVEEHAHAH
jgi:hypothetical protein